MATQTLKFKRTLNAPDSEVYRAFSNSTALREWLCHVGLVEARQGGRLYLGWHSGEQAVGKFTALEPNKKVAFTWHGTGEPAPSRVQVSLAPRNGQTLVTLAHAGIGTDKKWKKVARAMERGWGESLDNLQSVLETGQDLRFVRRPMLGIFVGDSSREALAKLGAPVTEGIKLDGVTDGMGAQAAGLQKNDVIVKIGRKKITGWSTLTSALQALHAGDKVPVTFYRGGEKMTMTMELSRRPLPDVPFTPSALAELVRAKNDEISAELAKCFVGVTEQEASFRPAPDEWSAKETIVHFIVDQRDNHSWIADFIADNERHYDRETGNNLQRIRATAAIYSTVPALMDELKRNQAETATMLETLPPEFVAHKGTYWRLGYSMLDVTTHAREHYDQIRATIEAARKN